MPQTPVPARRRFSKCQFWRLSPGGIPLCRGVVPCRPASRASHPPAPPFDPHSAWSAHFHKMSTHVPFFTRPMQCALHNNAIGRVKHPFLVPIWNYFESVRIHVVNTLYSRLSGRMTGAHLTLGAWRAMQARVLRCVIRQRPVPTRFSGLWRLTDAERLREGYAMTNHTRQTSWHGKARRGDTPTAGDAPMTEGGSQCPCR